MKEGAAEVDAYWQHVREGGEDCHAASSECSTSTLAQAVIMKRGLALNHGNLLGLPLGQLQLNLGKLQ